MISSSKALDFYEKYLQLGPGYEARVAAERDYRKLLGCVYRHQAQGSR